MTTRRNKLTKAFTRATAWLVLLVVGLGLTRSLVVCTQPCCGGHVKLAAGCDLAVAAAEPPAAPACSCCQHLARGHLVRGAHRGGGSTVSPTCGGCMHLALGVDLGMPPAPGPAPDVLLAAMTLAVEAPAWIEGEALEVVHPPATGPPRRDQRTALLATTVLRL